MAKNSIKKSKTIKLDKYILKAVFGSIRYKNNILQRYKNDGKDLKR